MARTPLQDLDEATENWWFAEKSLATRLGLGNGQRADIVGDINAMRERHGLKPLKDGGRRR